MINAFLAGRSIILCVHIAAIARSFATMEFPSHPRPRVREIARHYPHSASPRAVPVPAAPVRVHSRVRVHSSVSSARLLSRVSPTRARARPPWTPHRARTRRIFHRARTFRRRPIVVVVARASSRRVASLDAPDDSNACAPTRPHDRASSTAVTSRVSKDVFDDAHEPAARRPLFDYLVFAAAREGRGDYILLQMRAKTTTKARPKRWW